MPSSQPAPNCFVVDETPFCVWEYDLRERNREFIEELRPDYFDHLAEMHSEGLRGDEQLAAINLRLSYGQALETLFALLCAAIQAPDCVVGWLVRYRNIDLISLVRKIRSYEAPLSRLAAPIASWPDVASVVHQYLSLADKDMEQQVRDTMGRAWENFADDFLDDKRQAEYNSLKHGLRVRPGGFYLSTRRETTPGVPDPAAPALSLGGSPFGSRFFIPENVGEGKTHFRIRRHSLNWNPENLVHGLALVGLSLHNIVAFLRTANGADPSSLEWKWVKDLGYYEEPWKRSVGTTSFGMDSTIDPSTITRFTKEQILASYKRRTDDS